MTRIITNKRNGTIDIIGSGQRYVARIKRHGFRSAHLKLLREIKKRTLDAEQADILEGAFVYAAKEADFDSVPSIHERDKLFARVFGRAGQILVDQHQAEADKDVTEFMAETGITDETEARRQLVDQMVGGMEFFTEHHEKITDRANLMGEIEDAIGPVDWRDEGDE